MKNLLNNLIKQSGGTDMPFWHSPPGGGKMWPKPGGPNYDDETGPIK